MPNQNWVFFSFSMPESTPSSRMMIGLRSERQLLAEQEWNLLKEYLKKGVQFILQTLKGYVLDHIQEAICRFCLCLPEEIFKVKIFSKVFLFELKVSSKARLCLKMARSDIHFLEDPACTFGRVIIVFEEDAFGLYFLKIKPKGKIPKHYHEKMTEHEMIFTDKIIVNGKWEVFGETFFWEKNEAHDYENPFLEEKTILCIDEPRFNCLDEIAV